MFHVFFTGSSWVPVLINGSVILAAPLRASIDHQRRRFSFPVFRVARLVRDQTNLEGIPIPVGLRSGSFDRVLDMWWAMGSVWFVFLPCGGIFLELRALVYSRVFIKPTFATTPTNKQCGQIGPLSCNRAYTPNMQSHQLEQITWFEIDRLGITT